MSKEFNIQTLAVKDKVFRFAKKLLNNHEDAQDIVQDLFERLWKMRDDLSNYQNVEAFSIRIVKNLCLDKLKHEKQKTQKLKVVHATQKSFDDYDTMEHKDVSDQIKKMIQNLPEKQKMILHLRDVEGMDYSEITEILEMDINAVRMNLSRGRKAIKDQLLKTMNYGL